MIVQSVDIEEGKLSIGRETSHVVSQDSGIILYY